jgi:putative intracellular protease/amidase
MTELHGLKVAILVAEGFEQVELEQPREALDMAGAQTRIASPAKDRVQGWNHFDKGLVSSRKPADIPAFNREMLKEFDKVGTGHARPAAAGILDRHQLAMR